MSRGAQRRRERRRLRFRKAFDLETAALEAFANLRPDQKEYANHLAGSSRYELRTSEIVRKTLENRP